MNRDARDLLWQTENNLDERSDEGIRGGKMIKESKRRKNRQITRNKAQHILPVSILFEIALNLTASFSQLFLGFPSGVFRQIPNLSRRLRG